MIDLEEVQAKLDELIKTKQLKETASATIEKAFSDAGYKNVVFKFWDLDNNGNYDIAESMFDYMQNHEGKMSDAARGTLEIYTDNYDVVYFVIAYEPKQ